MHLSVITMICTKCACLSKCNTKCAATIQGTKYEKPPCSIMKSCSWSQVHHADSPLTWLGTVGVVGVVGVAVVGVVGVAVVGVVGVAVVGVAVVGVAVVGVDPLLLLAAAAAAAAQEAAAAAAEAAAEPAAAAEEAPAAAAAEEAAPPAAAAAALAKSERPECVLSDTSRASIAAKTCSKQDLTLRTGSNTNNSDRKDTRDMLHCSTVHQSLTVNQKMNHENGTSQVVHVKHSGCASR